MQMCTINEFLNIIIIMYIQYLQYTQYINKYKY